MIGARLEKRLSFDAIAGDYDGLWSNTAAGYWQRRAVWDVTLPLFRSGNRVLDVGCGTGTDAVSLIASGVDVLGIDASFEMVRVARSKGVRAEHLPAEQLNQLEGTFDGAISNFGVLNCVPVLETVAEQLGRLIKRGGYVALCYMGKFCAWEIAHYLASGKFKKATRRWLSASARSSLRVEVRYPSVRRVVRAFHPKFCLVKWKGIGIFVPPSYVKGLSGTQIASFACIDRQIAQIPILRAVSDHRLLILERV